MTRIEIARDHFKSYNQMDIETLFEEISVLPVADMVEDFEGGTGDDLKMFQLNTALIGWYAVANQEGIIAYFGTEEEAFRYRLDFINRILNG